MKRYLTLKEIFSNEIYLSLSVCKWVSIFFDLLNIRFSHPMYINLERIFLKLTTQNNLQLDFCLYQEQR